MSRIQQSFTGMELITFTVEPHLDIAKAAALGLVAHIMTGSKDAMVLAMSAMLSCIEGRKFPQIEELEGHAIHVRL